ncbi:hypothetical protein KsCSTR_21920 [Candidatus Kuenenia stuttgartiensis]|uniref:Uncharacterized protein n=1 Tax=Kuenenia stuttgartiensis TaxID=174633 RepID=Q1Q377_KUEST|nr:hypothetical protein KsCSTR_21920 [Candidatus Kuenenia stuttgartiensis]CAJ74470.1 unknown protein [Candidatus Kuenenia stuttgartiensis]
MLNLMTLGYKPEPAVVPLTVISLHTFICQCVLFGKIFIGLLCSLAIDKLQIKD